MRADWNEHRVELLDFWIQDPTPWPEHGPSGERFSYVRPGGPGSRPWAWWRFTAPRWQPDDPRHAGAHYVGQLSEPRKRLGGVGTPDYEVLAHAPQFEFGIPVSWVDQWDSDFYNGRALDDDGDVIETKYSEGDFAGEPVDPDDPPIFESQAAYLQRNNLLLPGERERLTEADFEPETVEAPEPSTGVVNTSAES
jgi:hypothetical protein